jgi:hypothetical protein
LLPFVIQLSRNVQKHFDGHHISALLLNALNRQVNSPNYPSNTGLFQIRGYPQMSNLVHAFVGAAWRQGPASHLAATLDAG